MRNKVRTSLPEVGGVRNFDLCSVCCKMSSNGSESILPGWQVYPENVPLFGKQHAAYDLQEYNQRLSEDSRRLFVPTDKETLIQVIAKGVPRTYPRCSSSGAPLIIIVAQKLDGLKALERYLQVWRNLTALMFRILTLHVQQYAPVQGCRIMSVLLHSRGVWTQY